MTALRKLADGDRLTFTQAFDTYLRDHFQADDSRLPELRSAECLEVELDKDDEEFAWVFPDGKNASVAIPVELAMSMRQT